MRQRNIKAELVILMGTTILIVMCAPLISALPQWVSLSGLAVAAALGFAVESIAKRVQ